MNAILDWEVAISSSFFCKILVGSRAHSYHSFVNRAYCTYILCKGPGKVLVTSGTVMRGGFDQQKPLNAS